MKAFTLRIPDDKNERIGEMAQKLGLSQNALIIALTEIGLDSYEKIIDSNRQEFLRFLAQKT